MCLFLCTAYLFLEKWLFNSFIELKFLECSWKADVLAVIPSSLFCMHILSALEQEFTDVFSSFSGCLSFCWLSLLRAEILNFEVVLYWRPTQASHVLYKNHTPRGYITNLLFCILSLTLILTSTFRTQTHSPPLKDAERVAYLFLLILQLYGSSVKTLFCIFVRRYLSSFHVRLWACRDQKIIYFSNLFVWQTVKEYI